MGQMTGKVLGNGCLSYFEYDPANRYASILNPPSPRLWRACGCHADASPGSPP